MSPRRASRPPMDLGPMPDGRGMQTVDEGFVRAPVRVVFDVVRNVKVWPLRLAHYRWVRVHRFTSDGGGLVEMSANRPFGPANWPTWWLSQMQVLDSPDDAPAIRFRHVEGITRGMDVEWRFSPRADGTWVRLAHAWDGPRWPLIGTFAARAVIGPIFVHGIASRTLAGLARCAELEAIRQRDGRLVGERL